MVTKKEVMFVLEMIPILSFGLSGLLAYLVAGAAIYNGDYPNKIIINLLLIIVAVLNVIAVVLIAIFYNQKIMIKRGGFIR